MRIQGRPLSSRNQGIVPATLRRSNAPVRRMISVKSHAFMAQPPEQGGHSENHLKDLVHRYRQVGSNLTNLRYLKQSIATEARRLGEANPISQEEAYTRKIMVAAAQLALGLGALRDGSSEGQVRLFLHRVEEAAAILKVPNPIGKEERSHLAQQIHRDNIQNLVRELKSARNIDEFERAYLELRDYTDPRGLDCPLSDQEIVTRRSLAKLDTSMDLAEKLRGGFRNTQAFEQAWKLALVKMDMHGIPDPISVEEMRSRKLLFEARELSQLVNNARQAVDYEVFLGILKKIDVFCEAHGLESSLSTDEIMARTFMLQYNDLLESAHLAISNSPTMEGLRRHAAICKRKAEKLGVQNPLSEEDVHNLEDNIGQKIIHRLRSSMESYEFRAALKSYREFEAETTSPNAPHISQEEITSRQLLVDLAYVQNIADEMKAVKHDLSHYFLLKTRLEKACKKFGLERPVSQLEFKLTELAVARRNCRHLKELIDKTTDESHRRVWTEERQEVIDKYGFSDLQP